MAETITVRPASAGDWRACAGIVSEWIATRDWARDIHTPEQVDAFFRDQVFPEQSVFVTGAPIDGFLSFNQEVREVTQLVVRDGARGRGVGKALLDHAKDTFGAMDLFVMQANARAWAFYLREGFTELSRSDGDNEEGLPDVLLHWRAA